ncbi:MAG: hypothetical protein JSW43_02870 [Gemmatimonadota bacterium]|nr:MAG: hypothetical protein JSW43_02870 [Gemmatimonadota bacterium]
MDLVQRVADELDVDEGKAADGLGAVFLAIRMALDARTFGLVADAFPDVGEWMVGAPLSAHWTGEILTIAKPKALRRLLLHAGFTDEEVERLYRIVGCAVRDAAGAEIHDKILETLPTLAC